MSTERFLLTVVAALAVSLPSMSQAKRTAEEEAAKRAGKDIPRVRLEAKFEIDEMPGVDVEIVNGREFSVKTETGKGKQRLDAEVVNFDAGTKFTVMVGNINIGSVTVELNAEGLLEGELHFRDAATWPAGLPLNIPAGTIVKFLDANAAIVAMGPLVSK